MEIKKGDRFKGIRGSVYEATTDSDRNGNGLGKWISGSSAGKEIGYRAAALLDTMVFTRVSDAPAKPTPRAGQVWRYRTQHALRGLERIVDMLDDKGRICVRGLNEAPGQRANRFEDVHDLTSQMELVRDVEEKAPERQPQVGETWRYKPAEKIPDSQRTLRIWAGETREIKHIGHDTVQWWYGGVLTKKDFLQVFEPVSVEIPKTLNATAADQAREAAEPRPIPPINPPPGVTDPRYVDMYRRQREKEIAASMTAVNASYQESERQRRDKEAIKRSMCATGMMNLGAPFVMGWDKRGRR